MIDNYRLYIKRRGREAELYLYPANNDLRCIADVLAALLLGHCVLIEPPGAEAIGGDDLVRNRGLAVVSPGGSVLAERSKNGRG